MQRARDESIVAGSKRFDPVKPYSSASTCEPSSKYRRVLMSTQPVSRQIATRDAAR
jgi:hypothetical protein